MEKQYCSILKVLGIPSSQIIYLKKPFKSVYFKLLKVQKVLKAGGRGCNRQYYVKWLQLTL